MTAVDTSHFIVMGAKERARQDDSDAVIITSALAGTVTLIPLMGQVHVEVVLAQKGGYIPCTHQLYLCARRKVSFLFLRFCHTQAVPFARGAY
jgi:hypothetical protein